MKHFRPWSPLSHMCVAVVAGLLLFSSAAAWALDLDQARAAGQVGERPDGLVGAVASNPNAEVRTLVDQINQARLETYRQLAQQQGTPLEAVQKIAGERQLQAASRNGWFVMDPSGRWQKR